MPDSTQTHSISAQVVKHLSPSFEDRPISIICTQKKEPDKDGNTIDYSIMDLVKPEWLPVIRDEIDAYLRG